MQDVEIDGKFELRDAGKAVAPDAVFGGVPKEALDHVQPRGARGGEMHDKARMPGEPGLNLRVFVGAVVVHDQVHPRWVKIQPAQTPVVRRQRTGGSTGCSGDESGAVGQVAWPRSVGLPEGRAHATADTSEQPHRRVASARLAARRLISTSLGGLASCRQGGTAGRLRSICSSSRR